MKMHKFYHHKSTKPHLSILEMGSWDLVHITLYWGKARSGDLDFRGRHPYPPRCDKCDSNCFFCLFSLYCLYYADLIKSAS